MEKSSPPAAPPSEKNPLQRSLTRIEALALSRLGIQEFDKETRASLLEILTELDRDKVTAQPAAETKEVTILLSDIRGFTAIAERFSTPILVMVLNHYFARMCEIIDRYNGTVDKFMGDAIMALFGVPERHDDDVINALSCGVEMQIAMDSINRYFQQYDFPELFMGIGINSGKVMAGMLGSELYQEYTVIGDEVNLASRIEAYSLRGQILISKNTYQLVKSKVSVGPGVEVYVKGKRQPLTLYELKAINHPSPLRVPCRETRKHSRVEISIDFSFQLVEKERINPEILQGTVLDISYNGIRALVPFALAPFTEIKFSLNLSLLGRKQTDIYAKILRSSEDNGRFITNMEFTSLSPQAKSDIKDLIDRLIQGDIA
ncbi:MAG: adenylate/guanylate cyclase domain-containing protein [Thermodesulfobacteriota bacterium]